MREFAGKTAFVTGGAAGIGLALGRAFARSGMKVMLADIETDALQAAVKSLQEISPDIRGTICDVADAESVERAAQAAFEAFGNVHVVCNNAGVAAGGGIDHISLDNWRWVIDVNLMGVLHGIKSFLPHIRAHGEGGHIVNTASMVGLCPGGPGMGAYAAVKSAVVAMSEVLRHEMAADGVGVSVLCPGPVTSSLAESTRLAGSEVREAVRSSGSADMEASVAGEMVAAGIERNVAYIVTHPEYWPQMEARGVRLREGFFAKPPLVT
jgi:NAD(P)-dependent dehydrogenase (short-subunit alcohol dehydrogenase family)